jgi:hypothetical protein
MVGTFWTKNKNFLQLQKGFLFCFLPELQYTFWASMKDLQAAGEAPGLHREHPVY